MGGGEAGQGPSGRSEQLEMTQVLLSSNAFGCIPLNCTAWCAVGNNASLWHGYG